MIPDLKINRCGFVGRAAGQKSFRTSLNVTDRLAGCRAAFFTRKTYKVVDKRFFWQNFQQIGSFRKQTLLLAAPGACGRHSSFSFFALVSTERIGKQKYLKQPQSDKLLSSQNQTYIYWEAPPKMSIWAQTDIQLHSSIFQAFCYLEDVLIIGTPMAPPHGHFAFCILHSAFAFQILSLILNWGKGLLMEEIFLCKLFEPVVHCVSLR